MKLIEAIQTRRDTRHFTPESVPPRVLNKALLAAAHGPSVGLSQPARFVRIQSPERRHALQALFVNHREANETNLVPDHVLTLHRTLKLEALEDAPVVIGVFCESPTDPYVIGAMTAKNVFEWSVACSVQNMWLALTEEGFSLGWVTYLDLGAVNAIADVPVNWACMGLLCVGRPESDYAGKPMLELQGWAKRKPQILLER